MTEQEEYLITKIDFHKKEIIIHYEFQNKEGELTIFPSVFSDFYLYEGKKIAKKEWAEINRVNGLAKDLDLTYRLLSRHEYSSFTLQKKLQEKKIKQANIEQIMAIIKEQRLIDDERYAHDLVEELDAKLYGQEYIIQSLHKDGCSDNIIHSFSFDETHEEEKMEQLLPILLRKWTHDNEKKRYYHLYNEYRRRGYDLDLITRFLSCHLENNTEDEKTKCQKEWEKYYRIYLNRYQGKELNQRIIVSLMRKGFSYDIIKQVMEDEAHEMD